MDSAFLPLEQNLLKKRLVMLVGQITLLKCLCVPSIINKTI